MPTFLKVATLEIVEVLMVSISPLCHQEFWAHRMVELLPSELATGQRTPTEKRKIKASVISKSDQRVFKCSQLKGKILLCWKKLLPTDSAVRV